MLTNTPVAGALLVSSAAALLFLQVLLPRGRGQAKEILCRTGTRFASVEERSTLKRKLVQAGLELSPEWFAGLRLALSGGFALIGLPLLLLGLDLFWIVLFAPLLYLLPNVWLNSRITKRKSEIKKGLEDFSVYLSVSLAAGAGLSVALKEAAEGVEGPLKDEVLRALRSYELGKAMSDALEELAERADVNELRSLVRVIVQAYRYGSPLADSMRAHSERMRTVRRFETMEAAGKLTVKLIFPVLVFMLAPAMVTVLYSPIMNLLDALAQW